MKDKLARGQCSGKLLNALKSAREKGTNFVYGINWGWGNATPKADLRRGRVLAKHGDSDTVSV